VTATRDSLSPSPRQLCVRRLRNERLDLVAAAVQLDGQVICIVEAMKMENELTAHRAGRVTELAVEPGQAVSNGHVVCVIVDAD